MLSAIREFDDLGQEEFLRRRGFAEARNFRLVYRGRFYDSKAIAGVAHGYATGYFADNREFSGGLATVSDCLTALGFVVDHGGKHARGGLMWDLESTKVFTRNGKQAAYKFVLLLWAAADITSRDRLIPLSEVRNELAELLVPFAVADSAPHPADPWVALRHSGWWELEEPEGVDTAAMRHEELRALAVKEDLRAGVTETVHSRLGEPQWRGEAIALLTRRVGALADPDRAGWLAEKLGL